MARQLLDGRTTAPTFRAVVDPKRNNTLTPPWENWFNLLPDTLASIPNILVTVSLPEQTASIATTDFSKSLLKQGIYRVSYTARITRAATTSSSLEFTFTWTDGGVTPTVSGVVITTNTTASIQSASWLVDVDKDTQVTYASTYASVGGTTMEYKVMFSLEKVKL